VQLFQAGAKGGAISQVSCYVAAKKAVLNVARLVEKLNGQIEHHQTILSKLFPNKDIESLTPLPREELLNLALSSPVQAASPPISTIHTTAPPQTPQSEGAESLEALEEAPNLYLDWDARRHYRNKLQSISDDVNGLALSVDRHYSYVGVSSTTAALKTIIRVAPSARSYIAQSSSETAVPSRSSTPPPQPEDSPMWLPPREEGKSLIESYFAQVHLYFPMFDERVFWNKYMYQDRKDSSWLSLLNIVFALGALASGTAQDQTSLSYYKRARHHMMLEGFDRGTLEVVQALGMTAGYYMHYLNRPNEAYAAMGLCFRMAVSLGLHREFADPRIANHDSTMCADTKPRSNVSSSAAAELRRRTWWSLFCLDTWGLTTTGRPSLGRVSSSGVTVKPPSEASLSSSTTNPAQDSQHLRLLPFIYNVKFCNLSSHIQDRLSISPVLKLDELNQLDAELVRWHDELPSVLTSAEPEATVPEFLRTPRLIMKWRYQNLRILMHRPYLLSVALRGVSFAALPADEKCAVGKCRVLASQTIHDIATECKGDLISGWNGVWMIFQACFIPLVSLFYDVDNEEEVRKWQGQIERALDYFDRMRGWAVAAEKSRAAVEGLFEASKACNAAAAAAIAVVVEEQKTAMDEPHPELTNGHHANGRVAQNAGIGSPHPGQPGLLGHGEHQHSFHEQNGGGGFNIGAVPAGVGMAANVWPEAQNDHLGNMNGFWDDMMWDTFPTVGETQFGGTGEFGWPADGGGGNGNGSGGWSMGA